MSTITSSYRFSSGVRNVDNQGWPPRPLLSPARSLHGTDLARAQHGCNVEPAATQRPRPRARPVTGDENTMPGRTLVPMLSAATPVTRCAGGEHGRAVACGRSQRQSGRPLHHLTYKGKEGPTDLIANRLKRQAPTCHGDDVLRNGVAFMRTRMPRR